ncbi:Abi-alpha family protein, partial [Escherichia coli]
LFKSADQKYVELVHPSFIQIIKQLTRDEALLLLKLDVDSFYQVYTQDLDRQENKFVNRKTESSTIPVDELFSPESMGIYYSHLESLSLVRWPITKQDPIIVQGVQVGIRCFSEIHLTDFGKLFVSACIPPANADI